MAHLHRRDSFGCRGSFSLRSSGASEAFWTHQVELDLTAFYGQCFVVRYQTPSALQTRRDQSRPLCLSSFHCQRRAQSLITASRGQQTAIAGKAGGIERPLPHKHPRLIVSLFRLPTQCGSRTSFGRLWYMVHLCSSSEAQVPARLLSCESASAPRPWQWMSAPQALMDSKPSGCGSRSALQSAPRSKRSIRTLVSCGEAAGARHMGAEL